MSSHFERAKEEITQALIREYIKLHPTVDEKQVVMMCREGKLMFSDIATIMAERRVNENFQESLAHSAKMVMNLAIQENERWEDCCASTEHSRLILDCLNSSTFSCIDTLTWREEYNYLQKEEKQCASCTIRLESAKEKMGEIKKTQGSLRTKEGRKLLIDYLYNVVDQLKILHRVLKKEVNLGDSFEQKATDFIQIQFDKLERRKMPFNLETRDFNKVFKTLKGNSKATLYQEQILEFNKQVLLDTRESLTKAVNELKDHNEKRRKQFHEIWESVVAMENTIKDIQVEKTEDTETKPRMARYSNATRRK